MKIQIKVKGVRGLGEIVETTVERDLEVGSGIRFIMHGTKYSTIGEVQEIDAEHQRLRITSPQFHEWIDFVAVRDVIDKDDLANTRLQAQIDHGLEV